MHLHKSQLLLSCRFFVYTQWLTLQTFAARADYEPALLTLGHHYMHGRLVKKDCGVAKTYYSRAARQIADSIKHDMRKSAGLDEPPRPKLLTADMVFNGGLIGKMMAYINEKADKIGHVISKVFPWFGKKKLRPKQLGPVLPHTQEDIIEYYRYRCRPQFQPFNLKRANFFHDFIGTHIRHRPFRPFLPGWELIPEMTTM